MIQVIGTLDKNTRPRSSERNEQCQVFTSVATDQTNAGGRERERFYQVVTAVVTWTATLVSDDQRSRVSGANVVLLFAILCQVETPTWPSCGSSKHAPSGRRHLCHLLSKTLELNRHGSEFSLKLCK